MSAQKQIKFKKKLPSGDMFMLDMTEEYILEKIKKVLCGKPRDILIACYLRKMGAPLREIARQLMKPLSTIRGWLVRMTERGIEVSILLFEVYFCLFVHNYNYQHDV